MHKLCFSSVKKRAHVLTGERKLTNSLAHVLLREPLPGQIQANMLIRAASLHEREADLLNKGAHVHEFQEISGNFGENFGDRPDFGQTTPNLQRYPRDFNCFLVSSSNSLRLLLRRALIPANRSNSFSNAKNLRLSTLTKFSRSMESPDK